uniref:rRNA-processing protein UTP23 homolog n=1 Tax=Ascaris lumbricoides TaxID=6252 RepID=A0A0M3IP47_ASCLU
MKVKRYKRAQRVLTVYRYNFGFEAPFRVLLDGTFAMAALKNKINLREQMPKYLNEEVEMCVTKCVLHELEQLGSALYGALHICKQFTVVQCPHEPMRSASDCLRHMARRMKNRTKYFIATQDNILADSLRQIPGTPILFIKYKGILIERVSTATLQEMERPKDELDAIKALKKQIMGDEVMKKRKRKKISGPNPLSVKKKKRKVVEPVIHKDSLVKKRRHRKKKRRMEENGDAHMNVATT